MNAAERLFLAQGITQTTVDQITAGASVSKGTFYLYFRTKEDVHSALGDRFVQQYVDQLSRAIKRRDANDWRGKISAWVKNGVAGFLDAGPLVEILFHAHPEPADGTKANTIVAPLEQLLSDGSAQGAWSIEDAHFTAVFLYSALHGVVDDALFSSKRPNRTATTRKLETLCMRTLGLQVD